jgi:hypothetical protein
MEISVGDKKDFPLSRGIGEATNVGQQFLGAEHV